MSNDITFRRRAIYTGLKPFLEENELLDALLYWEEHYATAPRFTLQRFVADLCREGELRTRRADVLLSLVQAMSMSPTALLPDPLQRTRTVQRVSVNEATAFEVLLEALMNVTGTDQRYSLRLDLLASLDTRRMPVQLCHAIQRWLGDKAPLNVNGADPALLRALVNRAYVILCERAGPVEADRLLARAVDAVTGTRPELKPAVERLL